MKLYFRDQFLGQVTHVEGDQPWMIGQLFLAPTGIMFGEFFRWMVCEENNLSDPPFDKSLLDESNWVLEDESGSRRGIALPAVHDDGVIEWRWR